MKRILLIILAGVILFIVSFFILGILKKVKDLSSAEEQISVLPRLSLPATDGTIISTSEITEGPVLIVRFHPECEHCRYELTEIFKSRIPEKGIRVLLISNADRESVVSFLSGIGTGEKQNIVTLIDSAYVLSDIFRKEIIPSNYIYDKDLKLVKALYGEYKIETICKYLDIGE